MLITNASMESRKVNAMILLNKLRHRFAGMLRFFSFAKNFDLKQATGRITG